MVMEVVTTEVEGSGSNLIVRELSVGNRWENFPTWVDDSCESRTKFLEFGFKCNCESLAF